MKRIMDKKRGKDSACEPREGGISAIGFSMTERSKELRLEARFGINFTKVSKVLLWCQGFSYLWLVRLGNTISRKLNELVAKNATRLRAASGSTPALRPPRQVGSWATCSVTSRDTPSFLAVRCSQGTELSSTGCELSDKHHVKAWSIIMFHGQFCSWLMRG